MKFRLSDNYIGRESNIASYNEYEYIFTVGTIDSLTGTHAEHV